MPQLRPHSTAMGWLTSETMACLNAIEKPHVTKKRTTVIRLAMAKANGEPLAPVFDLADTCAETIWYSKWKDDPAIAAAFEVCYQAASLWRSEETIRLETHYRQVRLRRIAELAATAPEAVAAVMLDANQRGDYRLSAADMLVRWAEPEQAEGAIPLQPGGGDFAVNLVQFMEQASVDELDRLAGQLESAAVNGLPQQADLPAADYPSLIESGGAEPSE